VAGAGPRLRSAPSRNWTARTATVTGQPRPALTPPGTHYGTTWRRALWVPDRRITPPEVVPHPVRAFTGTDGLRWLPGALSGMTYGTFAWLFKITDLAVTRSLLAGLTGGGTYLFTPAQIQGVETVLWDNNVGSVNWSAVPVDTWVLMVLRKATGTATPRRSFCNLSSQAWVHGNASATLANWTALGGTDRIGMATDNAGGENFEGLMGVMAVWANEVHWTADASGDSAIEAAGLHTTLQSWVTEAPDALWAFDQAVVTTVVDDLIGTSDQDARTGTTVVTTDPPPGFDWTITTSAVTGTLAVTQENQTLAATGQTGPVGTLAVTQANETLAATGTAVPPPITGTLAVTQANETLAASGKTGPTGTLAQTQAHQTLAAAGTFTPPAITGTLAQTQAHQTLAATGTVTAPPVTGTLAVTQAHQTLAGSGKFGPVGTLAQTQAHQTLAAAGTVTAPPTGTLAVTQAHQTLAAAGTVTAPAVTGTLAVTQANETLAGTGVVRVQGTLAQTQANQTLAASGKTGPAGTLAVTQAHQTLVAAGTHAPQVTGSLAVTQAPQSLSATGFVGEFATPAERTLVIEAERVYTIRREARLAVIERAGRTRVIRLELRTLTAEREARTVVRQ
jgi:hypothetical protein